MSERTAVYRLYAADRTLLYIGMTDDLDARFAHHARTKSWWPEVAYRDVRWYDTREEAAAAEDKAIKTERSVHNVAGSPWAPRPRELGPSEMMIGAAASRLGTLASRVSAERSIIQLCGQTRDRAPVAAMVPAELAEAAEQAGGVDAAAEILRKAAGSA